MAAVVSQAHADFIWQGETEGIKTNIDWQKEENWKAEGSTWNGTGAGPGTSGSNMWDTIVLEDVTFGSKTSRSVALEGWAAKFKLDSAQLYATMGKYQAIDGSYSKLEVYNYSVLDFQLGSGSFQGSNNTLIIGAGSSITFRDMQNAGSTADFNVSMTGAGAYLNFIAKEGSSINHTGAITINAYAENVDSSVEWGRFELGLFAQGVTLSSVTVNMEGWKATDIAITEDNYKGYSNCYSIEQDADGKYWVVYANESSSVADLEWTGGAISWSSTQFGSQAFNTYDSVSFTTNDASVTITGDVTASEVTIAEGVSVSVDGGDYQLTSTKGIDVQGTLQLNDDAIADGVSLTAGSNGKLVINGEVDLESSLKDFASRVDVTANGNLRISATNASSAFVVDGTLTIEDYQNNTQLNTTTGSGAIVLDIDNKEVAIKGASFANFTGTIDVVSGQLYVGNDNNGDGGGQAVTTSGDAKVIVREGSSLWVHLGGTDNTFASDVDLVSGSYLRNRDGNNVLTGDIRFNIVDPNAATPTYNASGKVQLTMHWDKTMRLDGLISGDGDVDFKAPTRLANTGSWKLTNNGNTFQGSYNLEDRTKLILGAENAALYSTINLKGSSNATLELSQNATIKSLNSTAQANEVRTTATAATLTVTGGSAGYVGTVGSNVTLNLTGGTFNIAGTIINNGTINVAGATLAVNDISLLTYIGAEPEGGWTVDNTDGFQFGTVSYYLIQGGTVTGLGKTLGEYDIVTDSGNTILQQRELLGTYYANTQNLTATAEDAARATGYVVADGLSITANHTGESKVINSSNISIGSNATLTLSGNIGIEGTGNLNNGGTLNFGGNAMKSTADAWNWKGNINISSDVTVSGSAINIEQGCTVTLLDGASLLRNENGAYRVKGTIAVADNAEAVLSTTDDIHFNYDNDGGEAVLRVGAGSTLNLTAKSFQHWGERGYIELGADSKLNVSSANFQIRDLRMNASSSMVFNSGSNLNMKVDSIEVDGNITMNSGSNLNMEVGSIAVDGNITLNEGSNLNMQTQGDQTIAGNVILNGGKILSENGNGDNRVKTIEHLSGSGEIEGSNWNVIWNIGELAGDGDITWRNNGTHWAPSVLNINGGTFTGTLTADRVTGKAGSNGNYQSVLQINEGGAKTLAGAVVNLQGNGADAYMQMALNTAEVSIGGLKGEQHSHIFAGSAIIAGGDQNQFCQNKANSTGTSVLKLASDEEHTYAGSVGAGISLEKSGAGKQFFSGDMSAFNGSLMAAAGELAFTATEALSVNNLEVANVGTLTVANGETAGSIKASGAVTLNGGATINAAVVDLSDASSVSFDVASGAITLNGALTMSSAEAFVAALGDSLAGLTAGDILIVFTGVSSFTVGDVTYSAESENQLAGVDLSTWSSDVAVGQYTITYNTSAEVGSIVITAGAMIPEPASATLSLAALMMLCARRRRRA